jgi:hypothetical protein
VEVLADPVMNKIPERFLRDAVLLGTDVRRNKKVSDEEFWFLHSEMHADWRTHWEKVGAHELLASSQNFTEILQPVMVADQTAVPGTAEAVLWAAMFGALPANFFDRPGKTARVRALGVMTTGATPGTLTLTPRYGTTTGGTSLGAGTVSGTLVASQTNAPWFLDATCVCRAIGASGQLVFYGVWESVVGYAAAPGAVECGRGAVTTVDTSAATGGLTIGATLSNAGSSLTTRKLAIESL